MIHIAECLIKLGGYDLGLLTKALANSFYFHRLRYWKQPEKKTPLPA